MGGYHEPRYLGHLDVRVLLRRQWRRRDAVLALDALAHERQDHLCGWSRSILDRKELVLGKVAQALDAHEIAFMPSDAFAKTEYKGVQAGCSAFLLSCRIQDELLAPSQNRRGHGDEQPSHRHSSVHERARHRVDERCTFKERGRVLSWIKGAKLA